MRQKRDMRLKRLICNTAFVKLMIAFMALSFCLIKCETKVCASGNQI